MPAAFLLAQMSEAGLLEAVVKPLLLPVSRRTEQPPVPTRSWSVQDAAGQPGNSGLG